MTIPEQHFAGAKTVLDVGGWFLPEPRATHVVDLMPWETRGAKLTPTPLPGECFSKATWHQADFLQPDFRLPFPDKTFDLVICGHTIEDLADPVNLLREIQRVARRGVIECPSRITEQAVGLRGREATLPGHPHHHWIVESVAGKLMLYAKNDSDLTSTETTLPLDFVESRMSRGLDSGIVQHVWEERIEFQIVRGAECRAAAERLVKDLAPTPFDWTKDRALRWARRLRRKLKRLPGPDDLTWWTEIVKLSQPYSRIPLK